MSVRLRDVTLPDFGLPVGRPEIPALVFCFHRTIPKRS